MPDRILPSTVLKAMNLLHYEAGWCACVLGVAYGIDWLGPAVVALLVAFHFAVIVGPRQEAIFLALAAAIGFLLDTAMASLGAFSFEGHSLYPWLSPLWMVSLWVIFSTMFRSALSWLRGRPVLCGVLGAIGGPPSYWAGAQLGAITLGHPLVYSMAVVAVGWAGAMPFLAWLSTRLVSDELLVQTMA